MSKTLNISIGAHADISNPLLAYPNQIKRSNTDHAAKTTLIDKRILDNKE